MAGIIYNRNPLDITGSESYNADGLFIDFLQKNFPNGFEGSCSVWRHPVVPGRHPERIDVADYDFEMRPDEVVVIMDNCPGTGLEAALIASLVSMLVSVALSLVFSLLFPPPKPDGLADQPTPSPVYSFRAGQNAARIGEVLPVIHGEVVATPDYIAQPYSRFDQNEQYVYFLLGLTYGDASVSEVLLGNTPEGNFVTDAVKREVFLPSAHGGVHGTIQGSTTLGIWEDVETSIDVQGLEMLYDKSGGNPPVGVSNPRVVFASATQFFASTENEFATAGQSITINGSADNDGIYTITTSLGGAYEINSTGAGFTFTGNETLYDTSFLANHQVLSGGRVRWYGSGPGALPPALGLPPEGDLVNVNATSGEDYYGTVTKALAYETLDEDDFPISWHAEIIVRGTIPFPAGTWAGPTTYGVPVGAPSEQIQLSVFTGVPPNLDGGEHVLGWFVLGQAGRVIDLIELDFLFPAGLYQVDNGGAFQDLTVDFSIDIEPLDDNGDPTTGVPAISIGDQLTFGTNTPQRVTRQYDAAALFPGNDFSTFRCRVYRTDGAPADASREVSRMTWTGFKVRYEPVAASQQVYEGMTVLAVRVWATKGISEASQTRIRARAERLLPDRFDNGDLALVPTRNPVDALYEIMLDPRIGGNRPEREIDLTEWQAAWDKWDGLNGYNAIADSPGSVWSSMERALLPVRGRPIPKGGTVSIVYDEVDASVPRYGWSTLTVAKGSLRVTRQFRVPESSGIAIAWRNPETFQEELAFYPAPDTNTRPRIIEMRGVTDQVTAENLARLYWQRVTLERRSAVWETELDGLLPTVGEKVALTHYLGDWGSATKIANDLGSNNLMLEVDPPASGWLHFRSEYGDGNDKGPFAFTRTGLYTLNFTDPGGDLDFALYDYSSGREPTHVAFSDAAGFQSVWRLTSIVPLAGNRVRLEAAEYVDAVYTGT